MVWLGCLSVRRVRETYLAAFACSEEWFCGRGSGGGLAGHLVLCKSSLGNSLGVSGMGWVGGVVISERNLVGLWWESEWTSTSWLNVKRLLWRRSCKYHSSSSADSKTECEKHLRIDA